MGSLNPIIFLASLPYLVLYPAFAIVAIVAVRYAISVASGPKPSPFTIDAERDPYEIAYLRGSGNELLRFAVFDLVRQGFLTIVEPAPKKRGAMIGPSPLAPPADRLSPFLQSVVAFYSEPRSTSALFASPLPAAAEAFGSATFEPRLRAAGFYPGRAAAPIAVLARAVGALVLIAVPVLRLLRAIALGHNNVGFLIVEGFVALIFFFVLTKPPRLSSAGRAYLDRLRTAMRPQVGFTAATATGATALFVAATGFSALAGTPYDGMSKAFRNSATTGSCSTCSSGDSGGGDGGGGGCGGGGCGG